MRVFSPFSAEPPSAEGRASRLSRALVAVGTGALLVLVIILLTGGFLLDAGPLHLSARRWPAPLVLALVAWAGAARAVSTRAGRVELSLAATEIEAFVQRHAAAIALVLAVSAIGVGIAYGTYAASGSDASGYVSESEALAAGHLTVDEPLARVIDWPDATRALAPLGYRPGLTPGEMAPTYPPGLPLVIAAARHLWPGDAFVPFLVVPLLGGLAVFCTYLLGLLLHSRTAGVVASALLATSPIFLFQLVQPMSDVPAAAWWTLAFVFAASSLPNAALAAGATAGLAVLTRPNLAPLGLIVALCAAWRPEASGGRSFEPSRLWPLAAGVIPAAGALLLVQWRLYGAPLASGYGPADTLFALENVVPNIRAYGTRLMQGEPASALLLLVAAALLTLTRGSDRAAGAASRAERGLRPSAVLAALVAAVVVACYLPYAVFSEWFYLRFLLPAFPAMFVAVGAVVTCATRVMPSSARGPVLLMALTAACCVNVNVARREQAFNLHNYEARYRVAGEYLAAALPKDFLVIAVQESGSARYYTGLPVVRWDLLRQDLDVAIADMRRVGRHPVFLVEDWEAADLRARFPASPAARLDWTPRVDVTGTTRVRVFDPVDRAAGPQAAPHTDRLQ